MRAMFSLLGLLIVAAIVLMLVKQQLGGLKAPAAARPAAPREQCDEQRSRQRASRHAPSAPGCGPASAGHAGRSGKGAPPRRRRRRGIDQAKTARASSRTLMGAEPSALLLTVT